MSKYRARPITIDNLRFASQREGRRYMELRLLEKSGEISHLELQPMFPITINGIAVCKYFGDFRYTTRDGQVVCEDTKGVDTPVSKLKRKCVAAQYGVEVRLT